MEKGLELIRQFEGCKLQAYLCPAKKITIGWGFTAPYLDMSCKISQAWADHLLVEHCGPIWKELPGIVKYKCNNDQLCALLSFVYNLGMGNFKSSTLLKKILADEHNAAAREFHRWVFAGKERLPGLVRRRQAESRLYNGEPIT